MPCNRSITSNFPTKSGYVYGFIVYSQMSNPAHCGLSFRFHYRESRLVSGTRLKQSERDSSQSAGLDTTRVSLFD